MAEPGLQPKKTQMLQVGFRGPYTIRKTCDVCLRSGAHFPSPRAPDHSSHGAGNPYPKLATVARLRPEKAGAAAHLHNILVLASRVGEECRQEGPAVLLAGAELQELLNGLHCMVAVHFSGYPMCFSGISQV